MFSNRALLRASRATATASSRVIAPRAAFTSQVRNYATPAAADPKPPVALYGLDGTYASALVGFSHPLANPAGYSDSNWDGIALWRERQMGKSKANESNNSTPRQSKPQL
jgi:hypothetical protein